MHYDALDISNIQGIFASIYAMDKEWIHEATELIYNLITTVGVSPKLSFFQTKTNAHLQIRLNTKNTNTPSSKKKSHGFSCSCFCQAPPEKGWWWSFGWVPWGFFAAPWGMWQHWINWSSRRRRAINVASLRLSVRRKFLNTFFGCFLKWWYTPQNTTKMIIFGRKTNSCWVPPF